jgi:poly(3-hydroxybutyrate) depolymerase
MMNLRSIRALACLLMLALAATLDHGEALAPGKGSFLFRDTQGNPDKPITVWFYRPARQDADVKVVFVMHGTDRNGETYRDHWARYAQQQGFLLLVPEFSRRDFSEDDYQFGGVKNADVEMWTFSVIEHLFDQVRAGESLATNRYFLYGHSAGAQFVHRYMLFMPHPRVALAISANAGSYTLPVYPAWTEPHFPWTLDKSLVGEDQLKSVFARRLVVLLGEEDTDPNHKHLPKSPQARAQGANRLERGNNFYRRAQAEAARQGAAFNWALKTVPGVGHSDSGMAKAAVRYIAEDASQRSQATAR